MSKNLLECKISGRYDTGTDLEHSVWILSIADTYLERMRGLMFRKSLEPFCGLIIKPCKQIHCFFMKFDIDVIFVDKDNLVVAIMESVKPGQISDWFQRSVAVIEVNAGESKLMGLKLGDKLKFKVV